MTAIKIKEWEDLKVKVTVPEPYYWEFRINERGNPEGIIRAGKVSKDD